MVWICKCGGQIYAKGDDGFHYCDQCNRMSWICDCGGQKYAQGDDGFYYCDQCNTQVDGVRDAALNDEDLHNGSMHKGSRQRRSSQTGDGVGPTEPSDFGSSSTICIYEDYSSKIRLRYVTGFHVMIHMQCKALVENFGASPQIERLVAPIWLRFLAYTRVMADEWTAEVLRESETQNQGEVAELKPTHRRDAEPRNIYGQRAVMIWYRSLKSIIPLSYSLAILFLVCHVARESILPTDILKGATDGRIPYFAAHVEIEKEVGLLVPSCPISCSRMFRPTHLPSLQKLESTAACVAQKICLDLPPVNFNAVASRYLRDLSLPVFNILPQASRIYEWSKHPDLYLSTNELRLPSRVRVMSILIVLIRMLYNLNGFGIWESSLSSFDASSDKPSTDSIHGREPKGFQNPGSSPQELLQNLECKYKQLSELHGTYDHSRYLSSYLQYCRNTVFAGSEPSFENHGEQVCINKFWTFYQNHKDSEPPEERFGSPEDGGMCTKRPRVSSQSVQVDSDKLGDYGSTGDTTEEGDISDEDFSLQSSSSESYFPQRDRCTVDRNHLSEGSYKERAVRELESNMEENKFRYIPPRCNVTREEYICYSRKKKEGMFLYAAHADYYILLRCCAALVEVDVRTMHIGVLSFERRLKQLELEVKV